MKKNTVFGNEIPQKNIQMGNFLYHYYAKKYKFTKAESPKLVAVPYINGYDDFGILAITEKHSKKSKKLQGKNSLFDCINSRDEGIKINPEKGLILGTMRMGFGHCRISIALASAAAAAGYTPYWFDLLSFPNSSAGKTIRELENWYNLGSRISQRSKLFNTFVWEKLTSSAGQNLSASLRNGVLAEIYAQLYVDLPNKMPFLSTHPWVGHGAVQAKMKNIITVVPDNYPMAFHLVEGTNHAVQSPSTYMGYRTLFGMGGKIPINHCLPQENIFEAGHFVDHEIVSNIEYDCEMRKKRIIDKKPRRFLLTMGGAGAQVSHFSDIIQQSKTAILQKKACFFINMGDHAGRWDLLRREFDRMNVVWTMHADWKSSRDFITHSETHDIDGIHVFLHNDFYAAVYATNLLMRISDIMITKPSELSFYPVPKLFIHRVGRHEAWGAIRSSECGDGTIETSSTAGLHRTLKTLIESDDLLELYCAHILENAKAGIYNGAYNVIKHAIKNSTL